jgi:hypothetical protein
MYDLRKYKTIDLNDSACLKDETTYQFQDKLTGKKLIAKLISYYADDSDDYLIAEFRKLALLSGEPEIATVYFLADTQLSGKSKSCYIMDFVDGYTLQEFLDKREYINYELIINLIIQIAAGLEKAHNFEISHGDLHNGNIMINKYGYVKLIDFLWYDFKLSFDINLAVDLDDFKRIINELNNKVKPEDKNRFSIILSHCNSISNLKGLTKEIQLLDEISFELSFLDSKSKATLAKLFEYVTENDLDRILKIEDDEIPDKLLSEITEQENGYINNITKSSGLKLKYLDSRIERINANVFTTVAMKLSKLKQIGLIEWDSKVINNGQLFIGPYIANIFITFNSKFFAWKRINDLLPFVDSLNCELDLLKD